MKNITLEDVKNILRIEVRKSLLHIHHYELGTNVFSKDKLNKSMLRVDKEEGRSCYCIDLCNNWCFSLFLLLFFSTGEDGETKKGYENYV